MGFFHGTRIGRAITGVLTVVIVGAVLLWNIPDPDVRASAQDRVRPVVNALVLNQGWGLFAPNPTRTSARVYAEVTFDDGSTLEYDFPDGDPFVGALREYHWRKVERRLRQDKNRSLWRPTAEWIAERLSDDDRTVTTVELYRQEARTPDAGSGAPLVWEIERFFTYRRPVGSSPEGGR